MCHAWFICVVDMSLYMCHDSYVTCHVFIRDTTLSYVTRHMWVPWRVMDSTENATPPKSAKSRKSNSSVQIQIKPRSSLYCEIPRNQNCSIWSMLGCSNFSGKSHKHVMTHVSRVTPRMKVIRLVIIMTAIISSFFTGVPVNFIQVFTGVPKFSNKFSPITHWLYRETVHSGVPNISSLTPPWAVGE